MFTANCSTTELSQNMVSTGIILSKIYKLVNYLSKTAKITIKPNNQLIS